MQVNIAVFGKNKEIVNTLERVINKNEMWKAYCSCTEIELQSILESKPIQILLYSSGIGKRELDNLEKWMNVNYPEIHEIHHFGGGSGLLYCEINSTLSGVNSINKLELNAIE